MATRNIKKDFCALCGLLLVNSLTVPAASAQQYDAAGTDLTLVGSEQPFIPGTSGLVSPPPISGCQDGNIQTLATASTSSGGGSGADFGPQLGNDGLFGPGGDTPVAACSSNAGNWHWTSAGSYPSSSWYQLEWPNPVTICQIFVDTKGLPAECYAGYNRGLHGADVQTWDGANWVTQGSVTDATDDWEFVLPSCVTTTRLRLNRLGVVSTASQASNPVLYELKVYDCSAPSAPPPPPRRGIPLISGGGLLTLILSLLGLGGLFARRRAKSD